MNFAKGRQPLVDSAFLSQAMLRAPNELWKKLEPRVQANVIASGNFAGNALCMSATRAGATT